MDTSGPPWQWDFMGINMSIRPQRWSSPAWRGARRPQQEGYPLTWRRGAGRSGLLVRVSTLDGWSRARSPGKADRGHPVGERQGDDLKLETRQSGEAGKGWGRPRASSSVPGSVAERGRVLSPVSVRTRVRLHPEPAHSLSLTSAFSETNLGIFQDALEALLSHPFLSSSRLSCSSPGYPTGQSSASSSLKRGMCVHTCE